jgi:rod shape-determining protein MreB and related proteins
MSRKELAVDLGTANTLVYQQGSGIVYDEPTLVAVNSRTGDVLSVGRAVRELIAGDPGHVAATRPLQRGAITDFERTQQMMKMIFRRLGVGRFPRPRVMVCVPSLLTPVERKAVEEAVAGAGAGSVTLVDDPLVAAIGAGLPIQDPIGNFVVDVGGGTCEMFMVAMGGLVTGKAIKVGGLDMDAAIQTHLRRRYGLAVGELASERIKIALGSAYPAAEEPEAEVTGRELSTGMPKTVVIAPDEIREVLAPTIRTIVETTRTCLAESPPELAHDVLETGLFLTGGGALLTGLDMRLARECEVPVHLTEHPLSTVTMGAGHLLEYLPEYRATFTVAGRV